MTTPAPAGRPAALGFIFVTVVLAVLGFVLIGAGVGALFWLAPAIAKPFYVAWYALACCIGVVVGNVLMALIFYVLVTGIGLLKRLGGSRSIRKTPDLRANSYWLDAPVTSNPKRYFSQF